MQSPGMAFADSFMKGFSLMDAYYSRKKTNERADARDDRQSEAHTINMSNANLQNKKLKREDWANQYQNIISDDSGNPINMKTLTPEQLQAKKQQFTGFLNNYEPIKADLLKQNPNRESVAGIELIMDKKTGQPMMSVNFKMKDGSIKPMTTGASSDPKDNVQLMGMGEVDNIIRGYLGQDMGIKPTIKEARLSKTAEEKSKLDFQQKKELAYIKAGTSPGGNLGSKQKSALQKSTYSLNNSNYGSAGLNGMFSFEGDKGQKRNIANVISDHLINSGAGTDAGSISAQAIQLVDNIYANGGQVAYNRQNNKWEMWDGSVDDTGNPTGVVPLNSSYKPDAKPKQTKEKPGLADAGSSPATGEMSKEEFAALKKRADSGDRDASIALSDAEKGYGDKSLPERGGKPAKKQDRSLETFMVQARKSNPGMSDDDIKAQYSKLGYDKADKAKAQARKNIDAKKSENVKGKSRYEGSREERDKKFFDNRRKKEAEIKALDTEINDIESKINDKNTSSYEKTRLNGELANLKRQKNKKLGLADAGNTKRVSAKRSRSSKKKTSAGQSLADANIK